MRPDDLELLAVLGIGTTRSASNRNNNVRGPHPGCNWRNSTIRASTTGDI